MTHTEIYALERLKFAYQDYGKAARAQIESIRKEAKTAPANDEGARDGELAETYQTGKESAYQFAASLLDDFILSAKKDLNK